MKKARYNFATTTTTATVRNIDNVHAAEKLIRDNALPTPPSEETVERLNAIAREYPFCAYMKQNKLILL